MSDVELLYSASDQESLDAGMPHLLECADLVPTIGISAEPLLGPLDLSLSGLGWVIVGLESGPRFRPGNIEWIESIVDQCRAANVPVFVKQDNALKSGQQGRIPDRLWKIKEFPVSTGG